MKNTLMLFILFILSACTKNYLQPSKEVIITVINECVCKIKFYKADEFYSSEIFDCNYTKIISMKIETGVYRIVAETAFGSKKEMMFEKSAYSQNLTIEF